VASTAEIVAVTITVAGFHTLFHETLWNFKALFTDM
jgi:hypothetical protein